MIQGTLSGSQLPVLQSQLLNQYNDITHFATLRGVCDSLSAYSQYNLCNYSGDAPEHVAECRKAFADALGIPVARLWFPRQVHGTGVIVADFSTQPDQEADAVITLQKGLCIGVSTADCVPVLLYDPEKHACAAIHAGWRGTVKHIVRQVVEQMCQLTGGDPSRLLAMVGPSISPEAFEVGEEVAQEFVAADRADCIRREGFVKPHIDLWQANVMDLLEAGVELDRIDCTPLCTFQNPELLFSARQLGINSGRIVTCIMMKPIEK